MSESMDLDMKPSQDEINQKISEACEASLHGPITTSLEAPVASLVDLKDRIGQATATEALSHRIAVLWELGDPVYLSAKDNEMAAEEANARLGAYRGRIVRLVAALDRAGVVDTEAWLASCELELLEATSFISSATEFRKKEVRYYTKAVYLQRRYSLMREASEGFAKVISVLASLNGQRCNVQQVANRMKLVIGAFHLDPHRVLDILLESLPGSNLTGSYAVLGELFEKSKVTHLLGWKFQDYYNLGKTTPSRLHDVAANLITCGHVDFPLLISYLKPEPSEYAKIVSKVSVKLREEIQKIERPNWEKKAGQAANGSTQQAASRKGHFSINRVDIRSVEVSIGQEISSKDNQVLALAAAFLRCSPLTDKAASWANMLMKQATVESVEPSIERYSSPYCSAMLKYIESVVEPLYWKLFRGSDPAFAKDPFSSNRTSNPIIGSIFEERESVLMIQFLAAVGHRMSQSPSTLCKVCWILAHEAKFFVNFDCSDWTFMAPPPELKPLSVEYVVAECLIPSLCCLPNCIHLAEDIYRILQFFPYPSRFLTYTNAMRCINSDDVTYAAGVMAEQAAKQIIRRVGNSEDRGNRDTVQSACQFRKLGVHAPFSVTAVLVSRAMSDDNLQEALALLMAQQMPLGFDAFGFWVVYHTINTKDSKVDNGEHSWWFKRLAKFLGRVCKEYPARVPLAWLFQVIIQELYSQELGDFHIVEEIFGEMTGFKANSLVGDNQVGALAGGPLLKSIILTTPWHKDKSYSAPSRCLMEVLRVPASGLLGHLSKKGNVCSIAEELVVLFNKAVACAPFMLESSDVKFTMEVTDRVMDTYVQFVDFLSYHLSREEYFRLLPAIQDSVNVYKCPPNWIFHAYRSLIVDIRDSERKEEGEICMDVDEGSVSTPGKMTFQWMVHEVMAFEDLQAKRLWDVLTPEFFSLFWTLTLADLQFPDQQYVAAEAELEANLKVIRDRLIEISDRNRHSEDRARREERRNLEREKEFWKERIRQLHNERDSQKRRVEHVKSFVKGVRGSLLGSVPQSKFKDLETMLVQHCFFPRIKMGMEEGQFTWEFIMFAHEIGMVNFHTIILLDRIVKEVFPMMHSMTDREGAGFRVFMGAFLKKMESWRGDERLYEAECGGRPGCAVNVVSEDKSKKLMDHCGLQRLNYKWVNRLSRILKGFLEPYLTAEESMSATNEAREAADEATHRYVLRRSGLLMLNHIGKYFPVLKGLANHLKTAAGYVKDYSKDDQLKNMANHFYNELDREFERQDRWVDLKDFGGLPAEKLNALRQRDKADAPTTIQNPDPEADGVPSFPAFNPAARVDPAARPQLREGEKRVQRRSSPIPAPSAVREPIIMRDRESNLANREREVPSGIRGRERPAKDIRSIPEVDGSRAEGNTVTENQSGRVDRPRRVRDERVDSRRRAIGPGGRTSEEDARRYGQRPRRNA